MKTIITILTAVLLSQAINAQTTIIPDPNFEQALIDLGYDWNLNGSIPTSNISSETNINLSNKNISDLTGIEDFTALYYLCLNNNQLTELDLSQNNNLGILCCSNNQITSLDFSMNSNLSILNCDGNQLSCLNVKNTKDTLNLYAYNNTNLYCIEVDDVALATANWTAANGNIDSTASFSNNCGNACSSPIICQASFTYTVDTNNCSVSFNNTSTGAASYGWDFGDGNTSVLTSHTHPYNNPGSYLIWLNSYDSLGNLCDSAYQQIYINCSNPTGIIGKTAEHGLSLDLYPNPVTSSLVVETEEPLKINLYNMQGQLLLDQEITATHTLNTHGLPKGIYLFKATDKQGRVYSQKIIKE